MRTGQGAGMAWVLQWGVGIAMAAAQGMANADQIRLKDGRELDGSVMRRDGEYLLVRLQRSAVETVNGQPLPPPVAAGYPAPAFQATDLAGTTQTLPGSGPGVTLVKFWATWCPHCRHDVPRMKEFFAKHEGHGARLVTISIDGDLDALQSFIRQEQIAYPVIHSAQYPALTELYEMQGVPAYYLIGSDGNILQTWSGSVTESENDFDETLARYLPASEPSPAPARSEAPTPNP